MTANLHTVPFIQTKLHKPQTPANLVARPWLLDWLNHHRQRPLTLISAPAGYGKTTLASSWLETVDGPSTWVSLDEYDDDLIGFLTYVIAAVQTIFPEACQKTQEMLSASNLPPARRLAHSYINDLTVLTIPFILVLDDYHVIQQAAIHELLGEVLRYPPPAMHLVITARNDPPLALTVLRARAQVNEIRLQELRFKVTETAEFLQQLGLQVDEAVAADLTRKTEGWAAGLRLATLTLRESGDVDLLLKAMQENSRHITDYLLAEVLNRLEPPLQDFLLTTSILDRLCGPLCDVVTESTGDGAGYLALMQEQNLFTIPLDDRHYWFRYHHLFQQLLQHQLHQKLDELEIGTLHGRAAQWYAEKGHIDEALNHWLLAGDSLAAAQLVEQHGPALLNEDKWYILHKWLGWLPDEIIQQRPNLLLARAWVLFHQFALWAIPPLLETIEALLAEGKRADPVWGEVDFFWGHHWYWHGQSERSLELLSRALARTPTSSYIPRGQVEIFWSLANQMVGQGKKTSQVLKEWLYAEQTSHPSRRVYLSGALNFTLLLEGELPASVPLAQQLQVWGEKHQNSYVDAFGSYLQALPYYCWNRLEDAAQYFARATERRYSLHTRAAIDSLAGLVLTYQALGQPSHARETMSLFLEFAVETNSPAYLVVAHSCQARLALLQGDVASAGRWLQTADLTTDTRIMFYLIEIPRLTQCRVLIAQGTAASLQQAVDLLETYRQQNEAQQNICQSIPILCLQALAYHKQAQFKESLTALERAVTLAQPGGFIHPFVDAGPDLIAPLEKLHSRAIATDYIGQILAAFSGYRFTTGDLQLEIGKNQTQPSVPSGQPKIRSPLIEPLTDRELEILALLAERYAYKEIAQTLVISPKTVKTHVNNIYQKLDVHHRKQAVAKARALGLLAPPAEDSPDAKASG